MVTKEVYWIFSHMLLITVRSAVRNGVSGLLSTVPSSGRVAKVTELNWWCLCIGLESDDVKNGQGVLS